MYNEPLLKVVMSTWLKHAQPSDDTDDYARSPPGVRLSAYNGKTDGPVCTEMPVIAMTSQGFHLADSEREIRRDVMRYFGGAREVQFLLLTEFKDEMAAAGCTTVLSTRSISRIRVRFLWFLSLPCW